MMDDSWDMEYDRQDLSMKTWKKCLEIASFHSSVPKIIIIGYTVLEIWHVMDVIVIFHFGLFFTLLPIFYPPSSQKSENFKKKKKTPGDIIILHNCTKNFDYRLYCSWDMARDTCIFIFHFELFFPFYLHNRTKNQYFKKMKKLPRDIITLHMCTKNYD